MKNIRMEAGVLAALGALAFTAACSGGDQAGRAGNKTQVIEESYTRESQHLGEVTEQKGDADVRGRRETISKRTEQVREEVPTIVIGERKADLNRLEVEDFRALGLSKQAAKNAVEYREKNGGRFTSVDQLRQVPGMDLDWFARYQDKLGISREAAGKAGKK